jgi:hypothetical protein
LRFPSLYRATSNERERERGREIDETEGEGGERRNGEIAEKEEGRARKCEIVMRGCLS